MKKIIYIWSICFIVLAMLSGCNTFKGFGEDVEASGEGIQNMAE